ncbi:MAG TPA: glutaminyl-peptide cyclotransferase [Ohtaekwangia sp.]|nr:glutaminyl-peptide cyclotransferase [Ohtaekwangia sp.]
MRFCRFLILLFPVILLSCGDKKTDNETVADSLAIPYTILNTLPHNPAAWTQGLIIYDNKIIEGTGQESTSWIAEVNPGSGEHDKKVILDDQYFGEGITILNNKLYQLTYKSKVGFIYDAKTYKQIGEFTYNSDGWGLTNDGHYLIMTDGSDKLIYLDTTTLKVVRTVPVIDGGTRLKQLNELEYINGFIYANIWQTNMIVKIDPATGKVVGRIDLSPLGNQIKSMYPEADVLNGIAYDRNSKALLVTGKLWPKAYLIRLHK